MQFFEQEYTWIGWEDVRDFAESVGLHFIFAAVGRPLRVEHVGCETPTLLPWSKREAAGTEFGEWNLYGSSLLTEAVERVSGQTIPEFKFWYYYQDSIRLREVARSEDAHFIGNPGYRTEPRTDGETEIISEIGEHAEIRTSGEISSAGFYEPARDYVDLWFTDGVPLSVRSIDDLEWRSMISLRATTDGLTDETHGVYSSLWTWTRQPGYQQTTQAAWNAFQALGDVARPPTFHPQAAGTSKVVALGGATVMFPDIDEGERAFSVRVLEDIAITL